MALLAGCLKISGRAEKPINEEALRRAVSDTRAIISVEDHYPEGGLGEAVRKKPKSGKPQELLDDEGISRPAIIKKVKEVL